MTKKILIVDDDKSIRYLLSESLANAGYHVFEAEDGEEAMRLIRSKKPNLIILDIVMPKMHGYEVCGQIRSDADPEIAKAKIIIMSVKGYPVDIKAAKKAGADKYIVKPSSVNTLLTAIKELLETPVS